MWPALLRPLVQAHGVDAVWIKGLEALGFPPTWAATGSEINTVRRAFAAIPPKDPEGGHDR